MIVLEIAMLLVGLGAIIYSFYLIEGGKQQNDRIFNQDIPIDDEMIRDLQRKTSELQEKAENLFDEMDDKISKLSNDKIMGMSEYSDQVLEKIEKNHSEVVFLYDMLNSKQEEIKELIVDVDSMKADIHDKAAVEYQKLKEQEKILDEIRKEIEMDTLEYNAQKAEIQKEWEELENRVMEEDFELLLGSSANKKTEDKNNTQAEEIPVENLKDSTVVEQELSDLPESEEEMSDTTAMYDAEIARIEEAESKERQNEEKSEETKTSAVETTGYLPLSQQDTPVNHNDEIIQLYKKGRSIIDISKMLSLGQGEVKFVIDLYNAR